ncbi:MAG: hypothetical protein WBP89_20315, partial [Sedimenticolaceae bacterium]
MNKAVLCALSILALAFGVPAGKVWTAALAYVQPPAPPIEAAIALSILFLGAEVLAAQRGGTSFSIRGW